MSNLTTQKSSKIRPTRNYKFSFSDFSSHGGAKGWDGAKWEPEYYVFSSKYRNWAVFDGQ